MTRREYNIVTNKNGRRILVVNSLHHFDKDPDISAEDYDAIFINISGVNIFEGRYTLILTSPVWSKKSLLKPRFSTPAFQQNLPYLENLLDGVADSPTDPGFTDFIEFVYGNIKDLNIVPCFPDYPNSLNFFTNTVQFNLSRGKVSYTSTSILGYAEGCESTFLGWHNNNEVFQLGEREFCHRYLLKNNYIREIGFVERVHLCPKCHNSHIIFIERCPKCHSSDITQESVIHHFRCANVSPESTYEFGDSLRCPKCKQILRHIGIDYDRPASVYSCNKCHESFVTTDMRAVCMYCKTESAPEELFDNNIIRYEYTIDGIEFFASRRSVKEMDKGVLMGHAVFKDFLRSIENFNSQDFYAGYSLVVLRYRIEFANNGSSEFYDLLHNTCSHFKYYKITNNAESIYLLNVVRTDEVAAEKDKMIKNINDYLHSRIVAGDTFEYFLQKGYSLNYGESSAEFIIQINEQFNLQ